MESKNQGMVRATVRGTVWTYGSFYTGKLLVFLTTVVLARLLSQEDFGVAGYALVAISFLEIVSDLGVGTALIFQPEDDKAASTAFWISLATGVLVCCLTWLAAPLAGIFFNDPRAVPVVQVLSLTFPISALGNTHDILLRKRLEFGKKFIPDFIKASGKGLVSVGLALAGMGAWSLIIGQLAGKALAVIVYWRLVPWRPRLSIDRASLRPLIRYGGNIVVGDLFGIILNNTDYLFIGRFLGAAALGVYSLAFRIPDLVVMQFCDTISRVIFPVYSRLREDPAALQRGFLMTMRYVALITVPLGLGITLLAKPFVVILFTDKWIEAAPVMAAIAIYAMMLSLAYNAGDVYKAQGKPEILTYLSLARAVVLLPGLYWAAALQGSVVAVGWVHAGVAFLAGVAELVVAARLLHTSLEDILKALRPALMSGAAMSAAVMGLLYLATGLPDWVKLVAGILVGATVYLGLLFWFSRTLVLDAGKTLKAALSR
jgi:O-antigen/teichoic acid export membrane protein